MNKKILMLGLGCATVLLSACGKHSSAYKELKANYDSLQMVSTHYEADLNQTDSLIAAVLTNFQEINSVETMIKVTDKSGDMRKSESQRIKDNVSLISQKLSASKQALSELTAKLQKNSAANSRLGMTVKALRKQLDEQTVQIKNLVSTLEKRNADLVDLDNQVNKLNANVDKLSQTASTQAKQLEQQDKQINTVKYCIGTSGDLEDMHIIKDGRVSTDNAVSGYFKTIDKRNLTDIPLESKKAKLLTIHPSSSYEFKVGDKGMLTLHIKDKPAFWSNSKILVIQVY